MAVEIFNESSESSPETIVPDVMTIPHVPTAGLHLRHRTSQMKGAYRRLSVSSRSVHHALGTRVIEAVAVSAVRRSLRAYTENEDSFRASIIKEVRDSIIGAVELSDHLATVVHEFPVAVDADNEQSAVLDEAKDEVVDTESSTQMVLEALADSRWDFRTVKGISKATGLEEEEVERVLSANEDDVRISLVPGENGELLYTVASRPQKNERANRSCAFPVDQIT